MLVIAGMCVIESEYLALTIAEKLCKVAENTKIDFVYKASFDKANRTSIGSFRGPGMEEGLRILNKIKNDFNVRVTTDVHEMYQVEPVAEVVDIIQIPAFLCRQTELLVAAAQTGKTVNVKKMQLLSAQDMVNVVGKLEEVGTKKIMLTERGTSFGYNRLVVDFTNIIDMKSFGYPVIFDATHSVQRPGGNGGSTGGNREYVPPLSLAAAAVGADGFFFETHVNPNEAKSDGPNSLFINDVEPLIRDILLIKKTLKKGEE